MLSSWFSTDLACRKYVDLINESSCQWANWNPPHHIEAGDFGQINGRTGRFECEGNIYKHSVTADLASQYPPIKAPQEKEFVVSSLRAKQIKPEDPSSKAPQEYEFFLNSRWRWARPRQNKVEAKKDLDAKYSNTGFEAQWQFSDTRGAFLVMHKPQMYEVPKEFLKQTVYHELLGGKMLVTESYFCNAYAFYLSNKTNETVKLSLSADALVHPPADGEAAWTAEGVSGLFRKGFSLTETYVPLYYLRKVRPPPPRRRDKFDPDFPTTDSWLPVETPWDFLDEEGEDEIVEF